MEDASDENHYLANIYRLMPAIKRPSYSIPWSQLRHMKKQERIQAKKEALLIETSVSNSDIL